ncbi:hypothetical protein C2E23DRAFT_855640 [Lenzites betulinus]|nr:hypothetical protein C2E23DRAFT_855640 [Lenzites betulinus]
MFSSGAARAFLVASLCSSVLSLPHLSARNVKRSLKDYSNNLVYTNPQVDALYIAIEVDGQTYGVSLDNNWGGLIIGSNSKYSSTQQVTIEGVSVAASSTHGSVSIFEEEIQIDYYCAAQWPTTWSSLDSSGGIYNGKIGWDITNSKSPINQYLAGTTQGNQNAWYYDLLQIWNWQANSTSTSEIEFEGIISVSETLSWDAIGISASDVAKYSLPDLSDINTSQAIPVRSDGRFCLDTTHWIGGSPVTVTSQVPSWSQGTIAGILDLTLRWSIMPTAIVEGLYGSLSGAKSYQYSNYKYWEIPCDSHLSALILSIDGHNYYIDATALVVPNPWGEQCIGSVFSGGYSSGSSVTYDVVLGFQLLSQFYFRAGIDYSNQPYYKMIEVGSPTWAYGGLSGSASAAAPWPSGTGNYGSGSGYQSSGSGYQGSGSGSGYGNNWKTSTSSTWSPATTSNTQYGNGGYQGSGYQGSGNTYNNGYQGTTTTYKTYATSSSMTYVASSRPTYAAGASTYGGAGTSSPNGWYYGGQQASSTYGAAQSSSTGYAGSGSGSQWGSGSGSSGSSSGSSGSGSGSYSGSGSGSESGSGSGSGYYGSGSGSQGGAGNEGYFSRTATSTVLYTSTREHFTTTTIAVYPSGTNYYGSGSGSGSGTNYGSGSGYSGSGSGYSGSGSGYSGSGYDSENLAVAGNAAETDDQGNDLNLPHGSIADQLKHCLPAIIVIVVLAAVGALASVIVCLVRRRRGNGGARPSAYRNLHEADNHAPVHVPLYGAEEGTSRYADPYSDKQ